MRGLGRLRRAWRRLNGRLARPTPTPAPAALLADALSPEYLEDGRPAPRRLLDAFRPIHDEATLAALAADPAADRGLSALAEGIKAGRQPFFDHFLEGDPLPDWLATPEGRVWPRLPAAAYDHADFTAHGDIRMLWELGRLQAAPPLAAHARLTGDVESARLSLALPEDFRRRNPVGWGPHWIAGLEAGLRIFSLLWTWQLLPAGRRDDAAALLLAASLLENGRFLAGHLSEKEIANNHLIGEAAALHALGHALPVFPESVAWRERGRRILDRELPLQVPADGVLGEQAIEYHRFVLEFYLQAHLWGRAAGDDASAAWLETMRAMFRPLAALYGPDGEVVSLGDDDAGRIVRLDDRSRRDAGGLLALGCRLLGVRNLGVPALALNGEALWLAGPVAAPDGCSGDLPALENFHVAGWHAARFGERCATGVPAGHVVFKSGPMGRGGGGHSHADQLAVTLSVGGAPVFVDAGTGRYNGPLEIRDHFRGGEAHNILRVNRRDAARPFAAPDRFGWSVKGIAELTDSGRADEGHFWEAARRGEVGSGGEPLTVLRRVVLPRPGIVIVADAVRPEAAPPAMLHLCQQWLCAPGCAPVLSRVHRPTGADGLVEREATVVRDGQAVLNGSAFASPQLEFSAAPARVSRDYGKQEAATRIELAGDTTGPWLIFTVWADPASPAPAKRCNLSRENGKIVLELSGEADETLKIGFPPRWGEAVSQYGDLT